MKNLTDKKLIRRLFPEEVARQIEREVADSDRQSGKGKRSS